MNALARWPNGAKSYSYVQDVLLKARTVARTQNQENSGNTDTTRNGDESDESLMSIQSDTTKSADTGRRQTSRFVCNRKMFSVIIRSHS